MFSFGFQQAFQRGMQPGDGIFFTRVCDATAVRVIYLTIVQCLDAAKSVIRNMIEGLVPSGYMRYAPDGNLWHSLTDDRF